MHVHHWKIAPVEEAVEGRLAAKCKSRKCKEERTFPVGGPEYNDWRTTRGVLTPKKKVMMPSWNNPLAEERMR